MQRFDFILFLFLDPMIILLVSQPDQMIRIRIFAPGFFILILKALARGL